MASPDRTRVWLRPTDRKGGPAPAHSLDSIGAAAVGLADASGLAGVSMRKVAAAIGAGAASLYRYVASHDELLEVMVDRVAGEYDLSPSSEPAADQLLGLALQGRRIMHRHPWLPPLLLTRPSLGPNTLAYLECALESMAGVDLPEPRKLEAIASLTAITSAFVQNELSAIPAVESAGTEPAVPSHLAAALASGQFPRLARAMLDARPAREPADDVFSGLVRRQLRGEGITCR